MAVAEIFQKILDFDADGVTAAVGREVAAKADLDAILNQGLIAAMDEVGKKFSEGELFVPEMLMAAQAMKAGLTILKPHLTRAGARQAGTVVIGTVKGDLHDIGKNLVAMMLEGAGFTVVDLGVDVETEAFLRAVKEHGAQVVALSALLTTTMPAMEQTIAALREQGLATKTMVGGAPVTQAYADKIHAHGYAEDAPAAVELARRLMAG